MGALGLGPRRATLRANGIIAYSSDRVQAARLELDRPCRAGDGWAYSAREVRMRAALMLGLAVLAGCSRDDGEKLTRVGRLTANKVRDASPARTPFGDLNPEATPAERVRVRLRTDANLVGQPLQVVDAPGGIHLRGRVATQEQADWAARLARETVGVTHVVNELAVGP
jgi:BON domain